MKIKTFQANIIEKIMSADEYSKFITKYMDARSTVRQARPVNDTDRAILADYKGKMTVGQIMKKYNFSTSKVSGLILKAVLEL